MKDDNPETQKLPKTQWVIDEAEVLFVMPNLMQQRFPRERIDSPTTLARLIDVGAQLSPFERRALVSMLLEYEMTHMYPSDVMVAISVTRGDEEGVRNVG